MTTMEMPLMPSIWKRHEPFFKYVRQKHPKLPVVMVSMVSVDRNPQMFAKRRDIIKNTWLNAKSNGDKNVWFIDGGSLFEKDDRDACTVVDAIQMILDSTEWRKICILK